MHRFVRSLGVAVAALLGAVTLAMSSTIASPVGLVATTVLYMRGTNIGGFLPDDVYAAYAGQTVNETAGDYENIEKVDYPAGFFPLSNGGLSDPTYNQSVATGITNLGAAVGAHLDDDIIVYGYSQSAVVASRYKAANPNTTNIVYVLRSNPSRPNGGILERFVGITIPILDVTTTGATPTTGADTYDFTRQYDGWADFPAYPLNLLAVANAIAGIVYLHGTYESQVDPAVLNSANTDVQQYDNTTYYTIGTDRLPILRPLGQIGVPDPILALLDAPLRVMVEWGYARETNPGVPTPAGIIGVSNPITDLINLAVAIPTGIDDAISLAITPGDPNSFRPFGTTHAGMYGVGGRTATPAASELSTSTALGPAVESSAVTESPVQKTLNDSATTTVAQGDEPEDKSGSPTHRAAADTPAPEPKPPSNKKGPLTHIVRGPIGFDASSDPTPPKAATPAGERPRKKVFGALTGQRSTGKHDSTEADGEASTRSQHGNAA